MALMQTTLIYFFHFIILCNEINVCNAGLLADLTQDVDYGLITVTVVREDATKWLRHKPKVLDVIQSILVKTAYYTDYLYVYEPYIDVIIKGSDRYFKIISELWDAQKPYENHKYSYYKQNDHIFEIISGLEYLMALKESYRIMHALDLADQGSSNFLVFHRCEPSFIGTVESFPEVISCQDVPIWRYRKDEGIVFLHFTTSHYHGENIFTLYFQDLNDNIISTTHLITNTFHYYLYPWIGMPKKIYVPKSIPELDACYRPQNFIEIKISMIHDRQSTPLVIYSDGSMINGDATSFISHPLAIFNVFMVSRYKVYFRNSKPYIVSHKYEAGKRVIYTLSYEGGNTVMRRIYYRGIAKYEAIIKTPATKILTFSLYLNGLFDVRMYRISYFTFENRIATVYTANRHLAFGRVYGFDGETIVAEGKFQLHMEQFIVCQDYFYLVIRAADGINFMRYYKEEGGRTWNRAMDGYPDFIPVLSEPS